MSSQTINAKKRKPVHYILLCIGTFVAISIRMLNPVQFKLQFTLYEIMAALSILIALIYSVLFRNIMRKPHYSKAEQICFAVFAFFESVSYVYFKRYSLHDLNLYMTTFLLCSLLTNYFLAQYGYEIIKYWTQRKLDSPSAKPTSYWVYFAFLIVPYVITLIINYPGFIMYDSGIQILQIYNIPNFVSDQAILHSPDIVMTTHHPFIHTIMIKFFLWIGESCGSPNFGQFLYTLTQITIMAATIAYILKYVEKFLPSRTVKFWGIVFALNPIVLMYGVLMTKDTIFACLFGLFAIKMHEYACDNALITRKKWWLSFLAILLFASAFRNNFMYVAIITLILMLVRHGNKKRMGALLAVYLCVYFSYSSVLIPALGVSNGSIREVISVPFQQTANYVQRYELTEEEEKVISKVLDVEAIKRDYNPEVSNPVKNTFNKNATRREIFDYFVTWGKMFLKHPGAYIDAYLNQFYGYFSIVPEYTAAYTKIVSEETSKSIILLGAPVEQTGERPVSHLWSLLPMLFEVLPVLYLITNGGLYFWLMMAAMISAHQKRQKELLWIYLPFLLYFATLLLSPANTTLEYRYMFPYLIAMPTLLLPMRLRSKFSAENKLSRKSVDIAP